jgi:hypothetical protein
MQGMLFSFPRGSLIGIDVHTDGSVHLRIVLNARHAARRFRGSLGQEGQSEVTASVVNSSIHARLRLRQTSFYSARQASH